MTYLVDNGIVVRVLRNNEYKPSIFIVKPMSLTCKEFNEAPNKIPDNKIEFKRLGENNGDVFYLHKTRLSVFFNRIEVMKDYGAKYVDASKDIESIILDRLNNYSKGFKNMWDSWIGKEDKYKQDGIKEMFKVIAKDITNNITI